MNSERKAQLSATLCTAIKPLLLQRVGQAVSLYASTLGTIEFSLLGSSLENIPLQKAKDDSRIFYISAIALKLAKTWNRSAMEIGEAIAANLSESVAAQDFAVQVVPPGWIHLQLTTEGLAKWLQFLTLGSCQVQATGLGTSEFRAQVICLKQARGHFCSQSSRLQEKFSATPAPTPSDSLSPVNSARLFFLQYVHARCCSLLRLAHREGIITLSDPDANTSPPLLRARAPDPFPWVDATGTAFPRTLRLVHPAELRLIAQLATTLDSLSQPQAKDRPTDWLKLAQGLGGAFESFYSACRIWGDVKTENLYLAQARLGLLLATQVVLGWILQDLFGVCAPLEV